MSDNLEKVAFNLGLAKAAGELLDFLLARRVEGEGVIFISPKMLANMAERWIKGEVK